jgi:hypothetical protein
MSKKAYAIAVAALLGATPIAFAAQPANHHAAGQSQGPDYGFQPLPVARP